MECAKDIILELKSGQAKEKARKIGVISKLSEVISEHKIITTIVSATISFIILDILLISSFVEILTGI